MGEGTSIINLGELAKPATVLVEKISDAVGGVFKPYQIKRVAKAEAEAAIIEAKSQMQITELQERAVRRFFKEEAKKQRNIEEITAKALPQLSDQSKPEQMNDDWLTNFFDKCRIVSDGEMQQLWSKVLAGEANSPGRYSKRTVNFLGALDKTEALHFTRLCSFAWVIGNVELLIYDLDNPIYSSSDITFGLLSHLDDLGLISFQPLSGYQRTRLSKFETFYYYGHATQVEFPSDDNNQLAIGLALLTQVGHQLAPICGSEAVPDFQEYVLERWMQMNLKPASPYPNAVRASATDI